MLPNTERPRGRGGRGRSRPCSSQSSVSPSVGSVAKIPVISSASSSVSSRFSFDGSECRQQGTLIERTNREFQKMNFNEARSGPVESAAAGAGDVKYPVKTIGRSGKVIPASCNYIRLDYLNLERSILEYSVTFKPDVDSVRDRFYLTNNVFKEFGGKVKVYDGGWRIFTPEKLPTEVNTTLVTLRSGLDIEICIKYARTKKLSECVQILDIIFKRIMGTLELVRFKLADYNPKAVISIPQHRLKIWPGYVSKINEFDGGIMLCCDTSYRVLRSQTCLDMIYDIMHTGGNSSDCREEISQAFLGMSVISNYNQKKIYKVDDVDFDRNPRSTFHKGDQEISYVDYYKMHYDVIIQDQGQPLLVHRVRRKEQGKEKVDQLLYLMPELCSPTGISDGMKSDFKLMRDMAEFTRPSPAERQEALSKFIGAIKFNERANKYLTDWNLKLPDVTIDLVARVLEPPKLIFGANKSVFEQTGDWGRTASSSKVLSSINLSKWGVLYTERNSRLLYDFMDCFSDVALKLGMEVSKPHYFSLPNENTKTFCDELKRLASKSPQILVLIFPTVREDRYKAVKKLCNSELGILTQVVNSRTISRPNALRSVVTKIVMQINCKLGGAPWGISIPFAEEGIMFGGIDIYHDASRRGGSVVALVTSTNSSCTRWTSATAEHNRGQSVSDVLVPLIDECLNAWKKKNQSYPCRIVIYRDGVSDGQLNVVRDFEVPQIFKSFSKISSTYKPNFTYIAVLKQTNTRLYQKERNRFSNPPPGTVMDRCITKPNLVEFYLVSQHVTKGTAAPTRFIIMQNEDMSIDIIQDLSFKLMHLYYNWSGTVRVPAPCMYARKLAFLVGEHMHAPATENLRDTQFFL